AAAGVFGRVTTATNGLKAGLVSVLSRFGAYGAAAAGVVIASDLMVDGFKTTDEWLLRQGSNFFDWAIARVTGTKSLAEQERDLAAAEEESRKKQEASTAAKEKHAAKVEMLKNASLGLNEVSKATVAEFDKQIVSGKSVSEALDGVAKSFNFDSTTSINNGITALLALQTQGKATGEEIRKSLTGILKDEDLGAFQGRLAAIPVNIDKQLAEVNAKVKARQAELDEWKKANQNAAMKDWEAATEKYRADIQKLQAEASALNVQYANAIKSAAMVQGAILDEAIRRTGLSYEELGGKSTKAFTSAKNDVNTLIQNLDQLKSKGVDVGLALDVSISKAINTATNQRELEDLKVKINDLRIILSSKVADGLLRQAEQQLVDLKEKADLARAGINSVEEAFGLFGMKTPAQLKVVAEEYKAAFDTMRNSGQATLSQQQEAFKQYAEKAIAANKGVADSTILSQASMLDMKIEVDATGKATVSAIKPLENALDRVKDGFDGIRGGARSAGQAMREEAKSSTEAWSEALTAMQGKLKASKTGVMAKNGYSVDEIEQQLTEMGYSGNARQKAKELFETAQQGPGGYYRSASHEYAARYGVSAYDNQKQTGNYMFIAEQLEKLEEYAGKSGSTGSRVNVNNLAPDVSYPKTSTPTAEPSRTVINQISINGRTINVPVDEANQGSFNDFLTELERIKKSS
ncbi:tape measure domain-containing protein, partial [Acinetobacter radioresistens]